MVAFLPRISAWVLAGIVGAAVFFTLGDPIAQSYANHDEIAYNSLAISLLKSGAYRLEAQPDGIVATEAYFAANPQLYPYLSFVSFKLFGVSRTTMRLPAALAFVGTGAILIALALRRGLAPFHLNADLLLLLVCPSLVYAARTARPEALSTLAIYAGCLLSLRASTSAGRVRPAPIAASGALATVAVWNQTLFAGCALLPLFFGTPRTEPPTSPAAVRAYLAWILGASLALVALVVVIVVPHWDAWKEQFFLNAVTISEAERNPPPHPSAFDLWQLALNLKARFSTFGTPYLAWYLCVPIVWFAVFRPTRRFFWPSP